MEKEDTPNEQHQELARRVSLGVTEIDAYRIDTPRAKKSKCSKEEAMREHADTLRRAFDISVDDILKGIETLQEQHGTRAAEIMGLGNSTHVPPIQTMEIVDYAMHGFVLIGCWCARSLVSNAVETIASPIVVGTPTRLFTAGKTLINWMTRGPATAATNAANQAQSDDSDSSSISEENSGQSLDSSQGNQDEDPVSNARDELAAHQDIVIDLKKILQSTSSEEGNDDTDPDEDGEEPDADEDEKGSSSDGASDS